MSVTRCELHVECWCRSFKAGIWSIHLSAALFPHLKHEDLISLDDDDDRGSKSREEHMHLIGRRLSGAMLLLAETGALSGYCLSFPAASTTTYLTLSQQ
jgi:hypothetical protein